MKRYVDRDMILDKLTDIKRDMDSNFVYACADTIKAYVEGIDYIEINEVSANVEEERNIH